MQANCKKTCDPFIRKFVLRCFDLRIMQLLVYSRLKSVFTLNIVYLL